MDCGLDAGLLWVNAKIRELKEYPIQAFQWEDPCQRSAEHILQGSLALTVLLGAEQRCISFFENELQVVETNSLVQLALLERIRSMLTVSR
jgi:hypothetical protein